MLPEDEQTKCVFKGLCGKIYYICERKSKQILMGGKLGFRIRDGQSCLGYLCTGLPCCMRLHQTAH